MADLVMDKVGLAQQANDIKELLKRRGELSFLE